MRNFFAASALALAAAAPTLASAEGVSVSAGATVASKYVTSGTELTKGPAFQPWMEAEFNGAYFGVWGSNVSAALAGNNTWESDVYVGYRNEFAGVSYDASYTRFYMNKTSGFTDEVALAVSYDITEQYSIGAKVAYDPSDKPLNNAKLIAGYKHNDKLSFEAVYGKKSTVRGYEYFTVGASYALNDNYAVSLSYHDNSGKKAGNGEVVVLALDYNFSFK